MVRGGDHFESHRTVASPGWGRDICLIHCTWSWARDRVRSTKNCTRRLPPAECGDLSWNSARTMGLTFQALAKMGPRIFIFIRFPLQLHSNANKPQNNVSHPESCSLAGCHLNSTHILLTLSYRSFKTESLITHFPTNDNGEKAHDCLIKAVCTQKGK